MLHAKADQHSCVRINDDDDDDGYGGENVVQAIWADLSQGLN